jgi:hypothetical protein
MGFHERFAVGDMASERCTIPLTPEATEKHLVHGDMFDPHILCKVVIGAVPPVKVLSVDITMFLDKVDVHG